MTSTKNSTDSDIEEQDVLPLSEELEQPIIDEPDDAPQTAKSSSGGLLAVVGGLVAGAVGFGASQYIGNDNWPFARGGDETAVLAATIDGQNTQISELLDKIQVLEEQIGLALADERPDQNAAMLLQLGTDFGDAGRNRELLSRRIGDLENRPIPAVGATADAVDAYERELGAMRKMFESELERIEAVQVAAVEAQDSAADRSELTAISAAVARLHNAIDSGEPLGDILDELQFRGIETPEALVVNAQNGVPSVLFLQSEFPAYARRAIDFSITAEAKPGALGNVTAFLKKQLGVRSLEPKDGDSTDAVLSRVQGALADGEIDAVLSILSELDDETFALMGDWAEQVQTRQSAVEAVAQVVENLK